MPELISLSLAPQELDYLCNVLAQRPYAEVKALIEKIVAQANLTPKPAQEQ